MKHLILAGAAALALALLSHAAAAAELPAGGMTIEEIAGWLQGAGYA